MFQSTHAHGVRHDLELTRLIVMCFNPRTHTACDEIAADLLDEVYVSIHARTRRATGNPNFIPGATTFQSTHAHGVRQNV